MNYKAFSFLFMTALMGGVGYYLITSAGYEQTMVITTLGAFYIVWLMLWAAWAFRWVVVFAPVVITYVMFAFYEADRSIVLTGAVVSGVLFVLTGIQAGFVNRKRRKIEKEEDKMLKQLIRRRERRKDQT